MGRRGGYRASGLVQWPIVRIAHQAEKPTYNLRKNNQAPIKNE